MTIINNNVKLKNKKFKKITRYGKNIIHVKTNDIQCLSELDNGNFNGKIKIFDKYGNCFQGTYKNNKSKGYGLLISEYGNICEGYFENSELIKKCRIFQNNSNYLLNPSDFNYILKKLHNNIFY